MKKHLLLLSTGLIPFLSYAADVVIQFPMEADAYGRLTETVSKQRLTLNGRHVNENIPGASGNSLRFDGYSTYAMGNLSANLPDGALTFSVWVAPETYPIILHDVATTDKSGIVSTLDASTKKGWAFSIGQHGLYSFDFYAGGNLVSVQAIDKLPKYEWSLLAAVVDPVSKKVTLYNNGEEVGSVTNNSIQTADLNSKSITIGKTAGTTGSGDFLLDTFNGLIDDITVYSGALSANEIASMTPENEADLSIPESRFANDLLRPKFHGMPAANWTNETHGMTYSDGKYHVFFQKNANGPYMSRLHWGHITSEDLCEWTEEKIAIAPGESYDMKGTWSGCVFTDSEITGDLPNIIYTGVDYQKAYIVQAVPTDASLLDWEKKGVIINGRPSGLSDDFRDPYFFRDGNNAYIIVGTAKNGIGATTLHKYDPASKTWSNDGKIFFMGDNTAAHGTFWEMPNVTPMGDGKWLFTVTPQATGKGVRTLYWIGEINTDGTFRPITEVSDVELVNGYGFGLLSPTIYQKDGKTIMMGIVPDILPTSENCKNGWAHLYSFPREVSVDENGVLVQKPFSTLEQLRGKGFSASNLSLDGTRTIEGVSGRQFEVKGDFKVGDVPFGFNIFKNGNSYATISYTPSTNKIEVNLTKLNRTVNDRNTYDGIYSAVLPEVPAKGSTLTLDVWVDGSILDIFVNDRYATSVRVYPTDKDANEVEAFSTGGSVTVDSLKGWNLDADASGNGGGDFPGNNGIEEIIETLPEFVDVYGLNGLTVKKNVRSQEAFSGLPTGIYIVDGKKIFVP